MRRALAALCLAAAGCALPDASGQASHRATFLGPATATISGDGASVTLRLEPFGLRVESASGAVLLDTLDTDPGLADATHAYGAFGATHHETVILPAIIQGWDHVQGTDDPWHHGSAVAAASWGASSASVDLFDPADDQVTLHLDIAVDGSEVRLDGSLVEPAGSNATGTGPLNQMGQSWKLAPDEHFYGLGERLVTVDQRGTHYGCWVEEGGLGAGEGVPPGPSNPSPNGPTMTHVPIPFFISSRGYGLWLDTSYRTGFSLGADDPRFFRMQAEEPRFRARILAHDDPRDTLAHYTSLTGRAQLPAPWVFGPRRRVDLGATVDGVPELQVLRDRGVPTTVMDDATHFLPIGSEVGREATFAAWTANAHALGFKADAYFNPYVSVSNPATADLAAYARSHGFFVKLDDGTELNQLVISAGSQTVATIDLTNPAAVVWYQSLLQRALDLGYDGWMLDFGEYIPQHAVLFDGRTGWEGHNAFPVVYEAAVFDYLKRVRGNDFMFFARAGYTGTQAVAPVVWSGDPAASFDDVKGLPAQVRAGLNAGLSGIPFWGSDISGYACFNDPPPDKEVYLRWAEFGAFSSDMHDENACASPMGQLKKWTLWSDAETTQVYGRYASLHTRLNPYLMAAAQEAVDTGMPVMRHPFLLDPTEPGAQAAELDYHFGPSLYVAPVVRRGALQRTLWLPPGTWFDWWTMAPLTGGTMLTREVPLDVLPLYLQSGGIVAMLDPSVQTLAPHTAKGVVSASDVEGVLDLRAAIDAAARTGEAQLVDGTVFDLALASAPALPAGVVEAPDEAALATCSLCGRLDPLSGGAVRVRITGEASQDEVLQAGGLRLHHHALAPLRARWDVAVLP